MKFETMIGDEKYCWWEMGCAEFSRWNVRKFLNLVKDHSLNNSVCSSVVRVSNQCTECQGFDTHRELRIFFFAVPYL